MPILIKIGEFLLLTFNILYFQHIIVLAKTIDKNKHTDMFTFLVWACDFLTETLLTMNTISILSIIYSKRGINRR